MKQVCTSFLGSAIVLMHSQLLTLQEMAAMWGRLANDNEAQSCSI